VLQRKQSILPYSTTYGVVEYQPSRLSSQSKEDDERNILAITVLSIRLGNV
jgi:hypothetical protein